MAKLNFSLKRIWDRVLGNRLRKMASDIREWSRLPNLIRSARKTAQDEFPAVQDALITYRAYLITRSFVAVHVDRDIWTSYQWLADELKALEKIEQDYFLPLCSLQRLRTIKKRWSVYQIRQKELKEDIERAPSAISFYNKMASSKERHVRERNESKEISQKQSRAYMVLDNAMNYFEQFDQKRTMANLKGSVLDLEKAREAWGKKIDEIRAMENSNQNPKKVVDEIESLAKVIFDAPALGKWVGDIEKRYDRLMADHTLLVGTYRKPVIPKEVQEETHTVLQDIVPKLWIDGQKDQLNQYLAEIENVLDTYEPVVEREIAFEERHTLKDTRVSDKGQSLSHLVDFTRIFVAAMDVRDPTMSTHSLTVTRLAVATAKVMNWDEDEIQYLEIAALLHDVGKLWIPESILTKKNQLSEQDVKTLRMHPVYGAQILQASGLFETITPWIYHHQELWNGSGYPDGLKEDAIPIQSRIISVCEAFAAMLTGAPTRPRLSIQDALARVQYEAGTFFDPFVVKSFMTAVETIEMDYLVQFVQNSTHM